MIGAIVMNITYMAMLDSNIEKKARGMGMVYPNEINVKTDKDVSK